MKIVIGNKNYSSWSLRPWLLMSHHQLAFEEVSVSLLSDVDGISLSERLAEYSDSRRVPVLIDNGLTVWDSLAICEYISETYLENKGWPTDTHDRAIARSLCAEMHSGFSALRVEMPMNCRALREVNLSAPAQADIARCDQLWSDYAGPSADGHLRLFSVFSIADCFFAPVVLRFQTYGIALSAKASAYAASLLEEPSIRRWFSEAKKETEIVAEDEAGSERH